MATSSDIPLGRVLRPDDARLRQIWTRERVIQALQDYAEVYGPYFTAAAFSPSTAKWRDELELVDRYRKGNPLHGNKPWPSLNAIKDKFDGSFNTARVAAGLEPNRPGPSRFHQKRPAGKHAPNRVIRDRVIVLPPKKSLDALKRADRAEARAGKAEREVARLTSELEKARDRIDELEQAAVNLVRDLTG